MCAERYLLLLMNLIVGIILEKRVVHLPRGSRRLLREHILKRLDVHDAGIVTY
jgi:hypothetical protein